MTTVAEKKAEQGYKTTPETCANCAHMRCRVYHLEYHVSNGRRYRVEVDGKGDGTNYWSDTYRCDIGGFAVKKLATCTMWAHNAGVTGAEPQAKRPS